MLSAILLLSVYLSCLFAQDEDIRRGDAAFISLKYDEAIKFYTNAIVADSGNVRAYYKRATVHQQRRAYREAMSDLNEVIQLDPEYHLALVARGKLNKDLGKFSQAKQDLEKVANAKKESSNKAKAKKELDDIIFVETHLSEGNRLLADKNFEFAKTYFTKAIEKAPQWGLARLARAKASLALKHYSEVIEDTMKVLKITPNDVDAIRVRADAFRFLGELDNAEKLLDSCLSWDSSNAVCAETLTGLKRWRAAYSSAEKRLENNLGKLALADVEFCLAYDPHWDFYRNKLLTMKAKALHKLNRDDEALALCDQILAQEESAALYIIKGDIYLARENYDEAVRQFEKAVNMGENSAQEKLRHAQKQQKMASRKDYYKILELTKSASSADIKKAYRKLAMLYHPDRLKNASPEERDKANARMKDVGEAYAVLSDAEKKAVYDRGDEFDQQAQGNPFYGFQGFQGFNFKFN